MKYFLIFIGVLVCLGVHTNARGLTSSREKRYLENIAAVCAGHPNWTLVPNLDDCRKFFVCIHREYEVHQCAEGFHFDAKNGRCAPGYCAPTASGSKCQQHEVHRVADDCTAYLACHKGKFVREQCPAGTYFDATYSSCQPIANSARHQCSCIMPEYTVLPNADDCETYYTCSEGRAKLEQCPRGEYFSDSVSSCLPDLSGICIVAPTMGSVDIEIEHSICPDNQTSFHPHESACNQFYLCINGVARVMQCAQGFRFDAEWRFCRSDTEQICVEQQPEDTHTNGDNAIDQQHNEKPQSSEQIHSGNNQHTAGIIVAGYHTHNSNGVEEQQEEHHLKPLYVDQHVSEPSFDDHDHDTLTDNTIAQEHIEEPQLPDHNQSGNSQHNAGVVIVGYHSHNNNGAQQEHQSVPPTGDEEEYQTRPLYVDQHLSAPYYDEHKHEEPHSVDKPTMNNVDDMHVYNQQAQPDQSHSGNSQHTAGVVVVGYHTQNSNGAQEEYQTQPLYLDQHMSAPIHNDHKPNEPQLLQPPNEDDLSYEADDDNELYELSPPYVNGHKPDQHEPLYVDQHSKEPTDKQESELSVVNEEHNLEQQSRPKPKPEEHDHITHKHEHTSAGLLVLGYHHSEHIEKPTQTLPPQNPDSQPNLMPPAQPESQPKPDPEPQPPTEPEADQAPQPPKQPDSQLKPQPDSDSQPQPPTEPQEDQKPQPPTQPDSQLKPKPEPKPKPQPPQQPDTEQKPQPPTQPDSQLKPKPESKPEPQPPIQPDADLKPQPKPQRPEQPDPQPQPAPKPEQQLKPQPEQKPKPQPQPESNPHDESNEQTDTGDSHKVVIVIADVGKAEEQKIHDLALGHMKNEAHVEPYKPPTFTSYDKLSSKFMKF